MDSSGSIDVEITLTGYGLDRDELRSRAVEFAEAANHRLQLRGLGRKSLHQELQSGTYEDGAIIMQRCTTRFSFIWNADAKWEAD